MVKAVFSEFSYGFALTHELVRRFHVAVTGAPVFPSLIVEGQQGGYDVGVPLEGWTFFLQFKVSQLMKRRTAMHWQEYGHPYYRFPIRPSSYSRQHALLVALAQQQPLAHFVSYVAPGFHEVEDLNRYFLDDIVAENSVWAPVLTIGHIADTHEHWVIFDDATAIPRFRSDSSDLPTPKGDQIRALFTEGPADREKALLNDQYFARLSDAMLTVAAGQGVRQLPGVVFRDYDNLAICAYLARTVFDAELLLALSVSGE
jgi:hypothetical protein